MLNKPLALAALMLFTMLAVSACERETTQAEPAETETAADSAPTGGDYHSTAVRARSRTQGRMEEVQTLRTEQVEEEKSFTSKSPAP